MIMKSDLGLIYSWKKVLNSVSRPIVDRKVCFIHRIIRSSKTNQSMKGKYGLMKQLWASAGNSFFKNLFLNELLVLRSLINKICDFKQRKKPVLDSVCHLWRENIGSSNQKNVGLRFVKISIVEKSIRYSNCFEPIKVISWSIRSVSFH